MAQLVDGLIAVFEQDAYPLHREAGGESVNWSLRSETLRRLADQIAADAVTAETGCGLSTAVFAALSSRHHCFTLDESERQSLHHLATTAGISMERVTFYYGDTAATLPMAQLPPLDAVLIDGGHAFPYPVLDFHYLAQSIKGGGLLLIDDVWMPSVQQLIDYLDQESSWRRLSNDGQTAWFQRMARDVAKSRYPDAWDTQGLNSRAGARVERARMVSRLPTRQKIMRHPIFSARVVLKRLASRVARR
jgi:protein-L-isoaspartate O-methyltransferase